MIDIRDEDLEIKIVKDGEGYRVWVNGIYGCLLRAYKVPELKLDIDPEIKATHEVS